MAITTVNPRYEGFIFDGENSRDYGIYVQDVKVFGAPIRDVEMVSIPGRDGEFVLDKGRFNNIQVVYTCALGTDTQTDFNSGVSDFRNWLASRKGYKRLEDEINNDEYRMAVFKDGLDVSTLNKETGTFEVTFDCKPQRFLKSGEIPRTIGGSVTNTQTKSGTVVSIDSDGGDKVTAFTVDNEATTIYSAQKNIADESAAIGFNSNTNVSNGYISVKKSGSSNYPAAHIDVYLRSGVTYTVSATCVQATTQARLAIRDVAPSSTTVVNAVRYFTDGERKSATYTPDKNGMFRIALFSCWGNADTGTAVFTDVQCEIGSVATAYEPYNGATYAKTVSAGDIVLYDGTTNLFADTGDISITYGHDPNKLVNPTLFESNPLLEVDGYGTISINGEEVVLHNEPLGRVQLGGGGSYKNSLTYHFDQTQFNTGDVITVPGYRRTYQFDMVKPYGSGQITDFGQVSQMTAVDYIFTRTKYQGSLTLLTGMTAFSVGTAKTEQYSITGILSYDDREETATPAIVTATTSVIYDGNGVIRFTAAVTIDEPQDVSSKTVAGNAPDFYGDSTWQPVTDTAYIDLDIGEAYVIQGGSVIGINNIVGLPAELPTLKAGANTLTYNNTVTELVILPRWWKV